MNRIAIAEKVRITITTEQLAYILESLPPAETPARQELHHYLQGISLRLETGSRKPAYTLAATTVAKRNAESLLAALRNENGAGLTPEEKQEALAYAVNSRIATDEETNEYFRNAI